MKTLKIILCVITALSIAAFVLAIYYTQFYKDVIPPQIRRRDHFCRHIRQNSTKHVRGKERSLSKALACCQRNRYYVNKFSAGFDSILLSGKCQLW